jgi:hypothetical protein
MTLRSKLSLGFGCAADVASTASCLRPKIGIVAIRRETRDHRRNFAWIDESSDYRAIQIRRSVGSA